MAHPNEGIYRELYRAFSRGDFARARKLLAPDVTFHFPSRVVGGDMEGAEAILAKLVRDLTASGGSLRATVRHVLANDEHVVALGVVRAKRKGRSLEDWWVQVVHVTDGRVSEIWHHPGDQYAVDEFWS